MYNDFLAIRGRIHCLVGSQCRVKSQKSEPFPAKITTTRIIVFSFRLVLQKNITKRRWHSLFNRIKELQEDEQAIS